MGFSRMGFSTALVAALLTTGCAAYRTDSNIPTAAPSATAPITTAATPVTNVLISEDSLTNRKYKVIGPIEVSVKKLTIFHKDPTKEMANDALTEKAKAIGADGVVDVTYKSGIGLTTWGYLDATGKGVKLEN
jgi:uncharacterized protein YbjQ (UPF0145 family)